MQVFLSPYLERRNKVTRLRNFKSDDADVIVPSPFHADLVSQRHLVVPTDGFYEDMQSLADIGALWLKMYSKDTRYRAQREIELFENSEFLRDTVQHH